MTGTKCKNCRYGVTKIYTHGRSSRPISVCNKHPRDDPVGKTGADYPVCFKIGWKKMNELDKKGRRRRKWR